MAKILLVEDDEALSSLVSKLLAAERHTVELVNNGNDAIELLKLHFYDLLVLDWMIPGLHGPEVCRQFRSTGGTIPVLMLTARSTVDAKEHGLDSGADDYLTKPFEPRELCARVRALLRRPVEVTLKEIIAGELRLDQKTCKVFRSHKEVHLLPKEYSLLELFMRYPNQVFSSEALLERVWPADSNASFDTVRTYIKTLRRKIDEQGGESMIRTVHGVGYRFEHLK